MAHTKQGHVPIGTTLRPEEITLVDEAVQRIDRALRDSQPRTYGRAGITRAALRYVLEHEQQFIEWLREEGTKVVDDRA